VYKGGNWDTTNTEIYVNGVKETITGGTTSALNLTGNQITFGDSTVYDGTSSFNGSISNFKLYDVAITADEVKRLYDMGRCDEGHHVVNFSKTRVGIGLGDGEAPRADLDVRGDILGGCPVMFKRSAGSNTGSQAYINWDTLGFQKGGGWTYSNYTRFYAPIPGYYHISVSVMSTFSTGNDAIFQFRKNGLAYPNNGTNESKIYSYDTSTSSRYDRIAGSTIMYLDAGDYMGIYNIGGTSLHLHYGGITGFYLSN
jgi:hypothetical protein